MGGEGQEARIVDRLVVLVTLHHHLEVVVQAGGGHAAQVRESSAVRPQRRVEVLAGDKAQIFFVVSTTLIPAGIFTSNALGSTGPFITTSSKAKADWISGSPTPVSCR
jgi:hypothetical protein